MARRKESQPSEPLLTRKHISRAEREAARRRQVTLGFSIVSLLLLLILGAGALYSGLVEPRQTAATVDGEAITREQFFRRINYERYRLYRVYDNTLQDALAGIADPTSSTFYYQIYQQQIGQLQQLYQFIPSTTLERMIEDKLIQAEADARGISVSDGEIDEEIRRDLAGLESAIIAADVTATAEANAEATATAESFTPTPEPTAEATAEATATAESTAEPTMTAGPTASPFPTATPNLFTEERYTPAYESFLADLRRYADYGESDLREVTRLLLLRTKLQEAFGAEAEVVESEPQVRAAHILVASEEEAQAVLDRIEEGESFEELAAELSTDTSNAAEGGDLGWFSEGMMVDAFAQAAFELTEVGELSAPVQTDFGWHVIKLLEGPEDRPRAEADIQADRDEAFTEWLTEQSASERVTRPWLSKVNPIFPADPFRDEVMAPLPTAIVPTAAPTVPVMLTVGTDEGTEPEATPEGEATPTP